MKNNHYKIWENQIKTTYITQESSIAFRNVKANICIDYKYLKNIFW